MTQELRPKESDAQNFFDIKRMRLLSDGVIGITENMNVPLTSDDRFSDWLAERGYQYTVSQSDRQPDTPQAYSDYLLTVSPPLSTEHFTALGRALVSGELVNDWALKNIDPQTEGVEVIDNRGWLPNSLSDNGASASNYLGKVVASSLRPLSDLALVTSEYQSSTDQLKVA